MIFVMIDCTRLLLHQRYHLPLQLHTPTKATRPRLFMQTNKGIHCPTPLSPTQLAL
jgi:hypothetical protein